MRILITGVAGHIGSRLARWILANEPGCTIVGVDDLSCGYAGNVPRGIDFRQADLLAWPRPAERFDLVFHLAAYAAECLSPFCRRFNVRSNWEATAAVINGCLAHGCGRLVFASSIAVYGRGRVPFHERSGCRPIDPYGVAKLACERDIAIAGEQHGLAYCIVRPHNVYGAGQSLWQRYRNVLGLWMRARLENRPLQIFGDGRQRRAFSYIGDLLPALWQAGTSPAAEGVTINLGGAQPIEIGQAAELVAGVIGADSIEHLPARHEVRDAWCTTERSARLLEYRDSVSLELGVAMMWEWAQWAWEWYPERRVFRGPTIEVADGLPPAWREKV